MITIQTKIYHFLQTIPVGKVVTYKIIADKFGIHPRMVAKILAQNKNQDTYPCYKVICNNGKIGGYNLGIDEKIRRLEKDGVKIENNKISKEYFFKN